MTRVETDRQPVGALHSGVNLGEVLEAMSQAAPLPRRIFEGDAHRGFAGSVKDFIQSFHRVPNPFLLAEPKMRPRMHDQEWQFERRGEFNLLNERLERINP